MFNVAGATNAPAALVDLSEEAFRRIASLSSGVIRVRIRW